MSLHDDILKLPAPRASKYSQCRLVYLEGHRDARRAAAGFVAEAEIDIRVHAHGQGQEHTIADVIAGRIDDLIAPRLERQRVAIETALRERIERLRVQLSQHRDVSFSLGATYALDELRAQICAHVKGG